VKLRKQTPVKAIILAATAGLLLAFYAAVRSEPRIAAQEQQASPVDYQRFFAPAAQPAGQAPALPPIRTRAS
jgi:hypothetical protein